MFGCNKGYFRFWCQKVLPLVYDESLSYYELLCKVVKHLEVVMKNLDELDERLSKIEKLYDSLFEYINEYIDNYLEQFDIVKIIENKIDELFESGEFDDLFRTTPPTLRGDVALDMFTGKTMQGSCYVGDGLVAVYCSAENSNTGTIYYYSLRFKQLSTQGNIEGFHGNSLTFDRKNRKIYICGEQSYSAPATLINKVIVIDLAVSRTAIADVINAPIPLYSLAYDNDNEVFYGIASKGTTDGEANRLYKFNKELTQILGYVDLEHFPAVERQMSVQGAPLVENGTLYNVTYGGFPSIQGYNPETGKLLFDCGFEKYFNNYRYRGELQSVLYDYDENEFYIGSGISNDNERNVRTSFLAKINLYHDILIREIYASNFSNYVGDSTDIMQLEVQADNDNAPATTGVKFNLISDAINYSKCMGVPAYITVKRNVADFTGYITNFCGIIRFTDTVDAGGIVIKNCKLVLNNMALSGDYSIESQGYTGQIVAHDTELTLRNTVVMPKSGDDGCIVMNRGKLVVRDNPNYDPTSTSVPFVLTINSEIHCCGLYDIITKFDVANYPLYRGKILMHNGTVNVGGLATHISSPITPRPTGARVEIIVVDDNRSYAGTGSWHTSYIDGMVKIDNKIIFPTFTLTNDGDITLSGAYKVLNINTGEWSTSDDSLDVRIFLIP